MYLRRGGAQNDLLLHSRMPRRQDEVAEGNGLKD